MFQLLRTRIDTKYMRIGVDERAFSVKMVGMNASDAGGPYR